MITSGILLGEQFFVATDELHRPDQSRGHLAKVFENSLASSSGGIMERSLGLLPSWSKRCVLCVILVLPAMLTTAPWPAKLFSFGFVAVMTGTTRTSRIVGAELITQMFVAFVPMKPERIKLKFVVQIETALRRDMNMLDWVLFGVMAWFTEKVMKWVWPWLSGDFELWMVTARDKRVLAWRGNGDAVFQDNLATLTSATGAAVRRI